jgi:hypothetical protein
MEGLLKIVAIKASINKGLSGALKEKFPIITPVTIPQIDKIKIKNSN